MLFRYVTFERRARKRRIMSDLNSGEISRYSTITLALQQRSMERFSRSIRLTDVRMVEKKKLKRGKKNPIGDRIVFFMKMTPG